jgi:DNA-binding phage protein
MKESTTKKLEEILLNIDDENELDQFLKNTPQKHPLMNFAEYLQSFLRDDEQARSSLCRSSGIERTYFYHILSGAKQPGRDKILRICIAMKMSADEAQQALRCGNQAVLYAKNMHDAVILFVLQHQLSVTDANELLDTYHLPLLD